MKQHLTKVNSDFTICGRSAKELHPSKLHNVIALLLLLCSQTLTAQDVEFDWAYNIGAASLAQDRAGYIHTDAAGNVYTTGNFLGPADFEPGPGVTTVSSSYFDAFISKVDVSGNLVWAKSFGGTNSDAGNAISVDNAANVFVIGNFYGGGDFDPGTGVTNLTSNGQTDIFIAKFNASGDQLWAKAIGGSAYDYGNGVATDNAGNVYITGNFSGTVDFDPGTGVTNLTSLGQSDIFIAKLDASGDLVWAKNIGGVSSSDALSMSIDKTGDLFVTGAFSGTVDFDPNAGTSNVTSNGSQDVYVAKLNSNGDLIWAKNLGGSGYDQARAISVDTFGNAYTIGSFNDIVDLDPSTGVANFTSNGSQDLFISKLNSNGDFVWAKSLGGTELDRGYSISIDDASNAYIAGSFIGTADFDPGTGTANLTSNGAQDAFVLKLNINGDFVWVKAIGGATTVEGKGIAADGFGSVYVTGDFTDTVDFDPGAGVSTIITNGSPDIFVLKLRCMPNSVTETVTACGSYVFDGVTYNSNNNTATKTLTNTSGCDSIITLDLTITNVDVATTATDDTIFANAIGAAYQWINCSDNSLITGENDATYVATETGNYAVIVTEGSCTDTSACVNVTLTGVLNFNAEEDTYQVYPNPATDEVIIANYHSGINHVAVMELTGKVIMSFKPSTELIDLSTLHSGIYFIQISVGDKTVTQKLIKH